MRARISPIATTSTGASTRISRIDDAGNVTLSYRPVHTEPLTPESEGGISLKKIAPKARVY